MRFLGVVITFAIREFQHRLPKPMSRERRKILFMKASRVILRGVGLREEPLT